MAQNLIKALTALVGRLSLTVGWENGPERGLKTVSFNPSLPVIYVNTRVLDQTPRSVTSNLVPALSPVEGLQRTLFTQHSEAQRQE